MKKIIKYLAGTLINLFLVMNLNANTLEEKAELFLKDEISFYKVLYNDYYSASHELLKIKEYTHSSRVFEDEEIQNKFKSIKELLVDYNKSIDFSYSLLRDMKENIDGINMKLKKIDKLDENELLGSIADLKKFSMGQLKILELRRSSINNDMNVLLIRIKRKIYENKENNHNFKLLVDRLNFLTIDEKKNLL